MVIKTVAIATAKKQGIRYLDITVATGDNVFAPTWDMVKDYKAGRITEDEYTSRYYRLMRRSYATNRSRWDEVLALDELVVGCYCRAGEFCHRLLLVNILVKCGATAGGEVNY